MLPDAWLLVATLLLVSTSWLIERRTGNIPNWLTLASMAGGLLLGLLDHRAVEHLAAWLGSAVVCLIVYSFGAVGGGAVKLVVATSTLVGGVPAVHFLLLYAGLAGLVWGVMWLRAHRAGDDPSEVTFPSSPVALASVVGQAAVAWWLHGHFL